jgi:hypothetical protein
VDTHSSREILQTVHLSHAGIELQFHPHMLYILDTSPEKTRADKGPAAISLAHSAL